MRAKRASSAATAAPRDRVVHASQLAQPTRKLDDGVRRASISFALGLLGLLLWPMWEGAFASGFRGGAALALEPWTFGRGGHVALVATHHTASARSGSTSWDSALELRIDHVASQHRVSVNPRRLAYLPMLLALALLLSAPLPARRKATAIATSLTALLGTAIASLWIIAAWLFARVPGLVYDLAPWQRGLLDFAYEALVTSPGNKVIAPLCIAGLAYAWQRARPTRSAS